MNGLYAIYYTGFQGSGFALAHVADGVITGADAAGGHWDGTYQSESPTAYCVNLRLSLQKGTTSVVDGATGIISLTFELPRNFGNGEIVRIETETAPLNVRFVKLREI